MEIDTGKFKGTKILDLITREPGYCLWLLKQKNTLDKPYFETLNSAFSDKDAYFMTWGKYKGLSLTQIKDKDPKYIEWLKDNKFVKEKCSKLVEKLNEV